MSFMQFTLKQLRYFEAVIRTGSIAGAAQELNISQSSISAAVETIEKITGTELVRRMPAKGVRPTRKGQDALLIVQKYLAQTRSFDSELRSFSGDLQGTLRLGCYAPPAHYILPPVLKHVSARFPSIHIDLIEGDNVSLNTELANGTIDIALIFRRFASANQPFLSLFAAPPAALIPTEWPIARQQEPSLKELADMPMILLDIPGSKPYFTSLFEARKLKPCIAYTTKSSPVLRGLVGAKFGYALLNVFDPSDRQGNLGYIARPIAGHHDTPHFGVAYTQAAQRSSIVQSVLQACQELREQDAFAHLVAAGWGEYPP